MTAQVEGRNTPRRNGDQLSLPMAANSVIYKGAIVCLNSSGLAVKGATATGLIVVGVAEETVDNTGGAASAVRVPVRRGVFKFANSSSGDAIALADYGDTVYIVDDQTVAKTDGSSSRSAAGVVRDVEADGVWVEI